MEDDFLWEEEGFGKNAGRFEDLESVWGARRARRSRGRGAKRPGGRAQRGRQPGGLAGRSGVFMGALGWMMGPGWRVGMVYGKGSKVYLAA